MQRAQARGIVITAAAIREEERRLVFISRSSIQTVEDSSVQKYQTLSRAYLQANREIQWNTNIWSQRFTLTEAHTAGRMKTSA